MAFDLINQGFYLSLSYHITNLKSRLSGYLSDLPIDKLFLETDDFDIDIRDLYKAFSEKCNVSVDNLKEQLLKNLNNLLHGK
jgi:TatD DNase family protein